VLHYSSGLYMESSWRNIVFFTSSNTVVPRFKPSSQSINTGEMVIRCSWIIRVNTYFSLVHCSDWIIVKTRLLVIDAGVKRQAGRGQKLCMCNQAFCLFQKHPQWLISTNIPSTEYMFWRRYNTSWLFHGESSSNHAVLTAAM
jgi:hypothetical protein